MSWKVAFIALVFWIGGFWSALGYVALTTGWWEYRLFRQEELTGPPGLYTLINFEHWQLAPDPGTLGIRYMRRPRWHLP